MAAASQMLAEELPQEIPAELAGAPASSEAKVELLTSHLPAVWRFLRRLGLSNEDADDLAQEVFIVAASKQGRIEDGHEKRFLFGIAIRIASRARRSQTTRVARIASAVEVDDCESTTMPSDEALARKEARETLDRILSEMSPELRTTFVLYELEEMTMVEISTLTEAPMGTVASRLRRAREQFQTAVRVRRP